MRHHTLQAARALSASLAVAAAGFVAQFGLAWLAPAMTGALLLIYGIDRLLVAKSALNWEPVPGRVISTGVAEHYVGQSVRYHYAPLVRFSYSTTHGQLESQRFTPLADDYKHHDRSRAEALASKYAPGAGVTVYLNPEQPRVAALLRNISPARHNHLLAVSLAGLLLLLGTYASAIYLQA